MAGNLMDLAGLLAQANRPISLLQGVVSAPAFRQRSGQSIGLRVRCTSAS